MRARQSIAGKFFQKREDDTQSVVSAGMPFNRLNTTKQSEIEGTTSAVVNIDDIDITLSGVPQNQPQAKSAVIEESKFDSVNKEENKEQPREQPKVVEKVSEPEIKKESNTSLPSDTQLAKLPEKNVIKTGGI